MPDRLAKDIMVPLERYATIGAEASLEEALQVMRASFSRGHRTLAVLDDYDNVVGFLTIRTVLNALKVAVLEPDVGTESWPIYFFRGKVEKLKSIKVKDVMRPIIKVFVRENTPLKEVAQTVLRTQVNNVPVVDREGRVVGIVRTVDLLDVLAGFIQQPPA